MDDNQQDAPEVLETPEKVEEPETPEATPEEDKEKEELKAKMAELESKNKQLFERLKKEKEEARAKTGDGLSTADVLYLAKADIHADDIADVTKYAEKMGVSIQDAHKFFKPILAQRAEERRTAEATATKSPRGTTRTTGEDLLRKALETGEVPTDPAQLRALAEARLLARRNKK